jgi:DNA-binding NarL/FixJ family response regulator
MAFFLLVDDDDAHAESLSTMLRAFGEVQRVRSACFAYAAFEAALHANATPIGAVIAADLAAGNGLSVLTAFRHCFPQAPALVYANERSKRVESRAAQLRAWCVQSPVDADVLTVFAADARSIACGGHDFLGLRHAM